MKYYKYDIPFNSFVKCFYSKNSYFHDLSEITTEKIKEIQENATFFTQEVKKRNKFNQLNNTQSILYQEAIFYVTKDRLKTFDEKIIFLILLLDPELTMLKIYQSINIPSKKAIEKKLISEEKYKLIEERKNKILELEEKIRKQLGFCDINLINYENIYYKKFIKDSKLLKNIEVNLVDELLNFSIFIESFNQITEEDFKRLNNQAQLWISTSIEPQNFKTAAYNILKQRNLLNIKNKEEMLLLFILIIDPELTMLTIYEEESKDEEIAKRAEEELGFYNKNLIYLEKLYKKKFCPNKKLSLWS